MTERFAAVKAILDSEDRAIQHERERLYLVLQMFRNAMKEIIAIPDGASALRLAQALAERALEESEEE